MEIYVHAPHLHADLESIRADVAEELSRFADRLTRIEVYLSDVNGHKGGIDKRCLLEARPRGLQPVAAEDVAADASDAVAGAARKLGRLLDHHFGRLEQRR